MTVTASRSFTRRLRLPLLAAAGLLALGSHTAWAQLKQVDDPGITTSFTRDALKRITAKTQNLTDAPASTHNVGYQWVAAGTGGAGQLSGITYPSGKQLTYQYDSTGQLTGMLWDGQPLVINLKWNPLGQPTSWTWPFTGGAGGTGVSAARTYNTAGQLSTSEIASFTWDAAGRVTQIGQQLYKPQQGANPNDDPTSVPLGVTSTFGYDAAGRLTSVSHLPDNAQMPSPWVIQDIIGPLNSTYTYDANSNRTQATYTNYGGSGLTNSLTRNFTLEAGKNRIASVQDVRAISPSGSDTQTQTFDWDISGKLMSYHGGSLIFERDPAGRIASSQTAGSGKTNYRTNIFEQRVRKQNNLETTATVYGDDEAFPGMNSYPLGSYRKATSNGQSITSTEYLYLPTATGPMPIAVQIGNELFAIHTDHLNTPRRLTDQAGQAAWQWPFSGFGEVEPATAYTGWIRPRLGSAGEIQNASNIAFDLRYPGQQYDKETGLYYNHHRVYDPYLTVGYMEADPLGLQAGWNRFGYVGGNALGNSDPAGLFAPAIPAACAANPAACALVIRICIKAAGQILKALAAGQKYELVDCEKSDDLTCPPEDCDPPQYTRCLEPHFHVGSSPHHVTDIFGGKRGRKNDHIHVWQMNRDKNGRCIWNRTKETYDFAPINLQFCDAYPSWRNQPKRK